MTSSDKKVSVIEYHNIGMSNKEISLKMKICVNTISTIINNYYGNISKPVVKKVGRKEKASNETKNNIVAIAKEHNGHRISDIKNKIVNDTFSLSKSTIFRILKSFGMEYKNAVVKPFLTDEHKKTRLQWAKDNENRDWSQVIFSDEASFWINKGTVKCWQTKETRKVIHRKRHSKKVHIWACIHIGGLISFYIFTENLRASIYERLLDTFLVPYYNCTHTFQQDNSPIHTAKSIKIFLKNKNIITLNWPPS